LLRCSKTRLAYLLDVAVICPAATSKHVEVLELVQQRPVLATEFDRVAYV